MKTYVAKHADFVRWWLSEFKHNNSGWYTKNKKPVRRMNQAFYYRIEGQDSILFIPPDVYKDCKFRSSKREGYLIAWGDMRGFPGEKKTEEHKAAISAGMRAAWQRRKENRFDKNGKLKLKPDQHAV